MAFYTCMPSWYFYKISLKAILLLPTSLHKKKSWFYSNLKRTKGFQKTNTMRRVMQALYHSTDEESKTVMSTDIFLHPQFMLLMVPWTLSQGLSKSALVSYAFISGYLCHPSWFTHLANIYKVQEPRLSFLLLSHMSNQNSFSNRPHLVNILVGEKLH